MNSSSPTYTTYRSLLRAAFVRAALAVVVVVALGAALGLAPAEAGEYLFAGGAAAIAAAAVALAVHGRFLGTRSQVAGGGDAALVATRLQALLGAAFAVKLFVVVVAVFLLQRLGTKFECTATFAVTFAAASIVGQIAAALHVSSRLCAARPAAPKAAAVDLAEAGRPRQS